MVYALPVENFELVAQSSNLGGEYQTFFLSDDASTHGIFKVSKMINFLSNVH